MSRPCTCPRYLTGMALQIIGATAVLLITVAILAEVLA